MSTGPISAFVLGVLQLLFGGQSQIEQCRAGAPKNRIQHFGFGFPSFSRLRQCFLFLLERASRVATNSAAPVQLGQNVHFFRCRRTKKIIFSRFRRVRCQNPLMFDNDSARIPKSSPRRLVPAGTGLLDGCWGPRVLSTKRWNSVAARKPREEALCPRKTVENHISIHAPPHGYQPQQVPYFRV